MTKCKIEQGGAQREAFVNMNERVKIAAAAAG
jgi:hypothetical protein